MRHRANLEVDETEIPYQGRHSSGVGRHRLNVKPSDPWPWIEADAAGAHPDYEPTHRKEETPA